MILQKYLHTCCVISFYRKLTHLIQYPSKKIFCIPCQYFNVSLSKETLITNNLLILIIFAITLLHDIQLKKIN